MFVQERDFQKVFFDYPLYLDLIELQQDLEYLVLRVWILYESAVSAFCLFKQLNLHITILSLVPEVDVCDFFSPHADVYALVVLGQHLHAVTANAR